MRVVIDTNVIISGLTYRGNKHRVLALAEERRFELLLSPFILDEVERVLARKFQRDTQTIARDIAKLRGIATVIDPDPLTDVVPGGHADNRILDCAATAQAGFLITGDQRHLLPLGEHRGTRIVNAVGFLEAMRE